MIRALYIIVCSICIYAFFMGYTQKFICALMLTGCAWCLIYFGNVFFRLIKHFSKWMIKKIKSFIAHIKYHPERSRWILLLLFLIALSAPLWLDIFQNIWNGAIRNHWYLFGAICISLIWIVFIAGEKILCWYKAYKVMLSKNNISIFGEDEDNQNFSDFILYFVNIEKQSLVWIRKFIIVFCIPLSIGGYAIGLLVQWKNIYNALSLASLGIALFSIWYTVNLRFDRRATGDNAEGQFTDAPTKQESNNSTNQKWHEK